MDRSTFRRVIDRLLRISPRRLVLAAAGIVCVGLAALGVVVPGLPTTVFLIAATYLFTRSCPWLEERLIRNRFFAPFLGYLDGSATMPLRAKIMTMGVMWAFVTASVWILAVGSTAPVWVLSLPPAGALIGTWFIARIGPAANPSRLSGESSL